MQMASSQTGVIATAASVSVRLWDRITAARVSMVQPMACFIGHIFMTMARRAWRIMSSVDALVSTPFRAVEISAGE